MKSPIKGEPPRTKYFPAKERRQGEAVWIGPTEKAERFLDERNANSFAETEYGKIAERKLRNCSNPRYRRRLVRFFIG